MNALDRLCSAETCREILEAMTPRQLEVAAWRWGGFNGIEVAELLGISNSAVSLHMSNARYRVAQAVPEVMGDVLSRRYPCAPAEQEGEVRRCVDCGVVVTRRSVRCHPCSNRENGRKRRRNGS